MSFAASIAVSQNILSPMALTILDDSTGTDAAIVTRHVFLETAMGTFLVPSGITTDYNNWPEPDATISLAVLDQDYALNIRVNWLDINGATLYTFQQVYAFTLYSQQFFYYLTQQQAAGNANLQDTNYFTNKSKLFLFITSANNAVQYASDIYAGQECLDSAAFMIENQNLYF